MIFLGIKRSLGFETKAILFDLLQDDSTGPVERPNEKESKDEMEGHGVAASLLQNHANHWNHHDESDAEVVELQKILVKVEINWT